MTSQQMKPPDQIEPDSSLPTPDSDSTARARERVPPPTILLAEDDRSLRRYLEVILQKAGYTVITAGDGLEAMKLALTTTIHAVITDAIMPQINGHELCRFLRQQAKLAHLPIILLSGLENVAPDIPKEDSADLYLTKPVNPNELIKSLERLL